MQGNPGLALKDKRYVEKSSLFYYIAHINV